MKLMFAGEFAPPRGFRKKRSSQRSAFVDELGSFFLYGLLLLAVNALSAAPAGNVDNDYKDALSLFENRDIVSRQKAIQILERNLEINAEHTDTQGLIAYAYAHEAYLMQQLGENATDYLTSAEAFAKTVLSKQPGNIYAKKTIIFLYLVGGLQVDASQRIAREMTDKETDADMWYMQAIVSEGEKSRRSLARALELKPNNVWIYSDMAFRAIQLNDLPLAEKWIAALETKAPAIADLDLLKAVVAAEKKNRKDLQAHWSAFSAKVTNVPIMSRLMDKMLKAQASP
jgi:tetratricopeptide (TPR) repeat protein